LDQVVHTYYQALTFVHKHTKI